MKQSKLRGCTTPRLFSPPLRELTPETSHGFACIAFAEGVLGLTLFPWQKWLLIHALELREDGLYRFRTVIVLVARQNGKTLVMLVLALWHIYVRGSRTVIGTAQDLTNAEKAWAEAVEMAQDVPDLAEEIAQVIKQAGKQSLKLSSKEQYRVAAASRRGARGFSGDLVLLDELREHQSWDAWGASTKTTLARPEAQVWCFSNAGDALSIVLRYLRATVHQALGWPDGNDDEAALGMADDLTEEDLEDGDSLGLFEWSADPKAARNDREAWAQANPSMNYTELVEQVITERSIAAAMRTDPVSVFLTEVLCRWISTADGGPFPEGKWADTLDASARIADDSRRVVAVDVSWDRSMTYVGRGGFGDDGIPVVDIAAARAGTDWAVAWLVEHRERYDAVAIQSSNSPSSSLYDAILTAKLPNGEPANLPLVEWSGPDLSRASGIAYDAVDKGAVKHLPHPGLDGAATTARIKSLGESWVIDRKNSPMDAAPLVTVIEVLWLLGQEQEAPKRSAYEDHDFELL
ncbi:terminase large subunit domain-containing protein [Rhodococcus globerulus]|uniref:Terminase family protein n=1 Tax=Rhodococcus globerulus TaxID=33008 RepID=A0ABU4BS67_RHOGO|nr:terminase family protein [Rhodococcus globerulus]MDV6267066.1 terminase family protein [Rhodococcus globerulus]